LSSLAEISGCTSASRPNGLTMKLWLFCRTDAEGSGGNKIKGTSLIGAEGIDVLAMKPKCC
jgi:hypothetical protein